MSEETRNPVRVPVLLWLRLMRDLRKRGKGRRESGAFLLGVRGKKQDVVKKYIPYDELDPHALDSGIIVVRPIGFMKLWQDCKRLKLQVLADVHTHPGAWTDQSDSDRTHPMISQAGHIALIVPQFAASRCCKFNGVGIFDYLGDYKWNDLRGPNRRRRLSFRLW